MSEKEHSSTESPQQHPKEEADNLASKEFESFAEQSQPGILREFLEFAIENKKWWLIPIILVLSLIGVLIFISGTVGPFIYPLF